MTYAEKFRILRETLNWPATHMMAYIDAGYTVPGYSIYTMIETGKREEASDYLIRALCAAFYVNLDWMRKGRGEILLSDCRVRSDIDTISRRAEGRWLGKSYSRLLAIADEMNVGLEWLVCGDERAKENPCNSSMISYLRQHEDIRKTIWLEMGEINYTEFYMRIKAGGGVTIRDRIRTIRETMGFLINEFDELVGVGVEHPVRSDISIIKIATACDIGKDWIKTGNEKALAFPCDQKMILWLREHPEVRAEIARRK